MGHILRQGVDRATGQRGRSSLLTIYILALAGIAVIVLLLVSSFLQTPWWRTLVFFGALSVVAECFPVPLPRGGAVSVSFATNFAAILLCGPGAAWVASLDGLANVVRRRASPERATFNVAQVIVTVGASGFAYQFSGGHIGFPQLPDDAMPMLFSALTYFLVNASLVTGVISVSEGTPFRVTWSGNISGVLRNYLALAPLGFLIGAAYPYIGMLGTTLFFIPLVLARYSFQEYMKMKELYAGTVRGLAAALEAKDKYTRGHSDRVAVYSAAIARQLHMGESEVEKVEYTGLLHDIGKIGVPDELLSKSGQLRTDEFQTIQQHPVTGARILSEISFLRDVAATIRCHHERLDGHGYPNGLTERDIPFHARILAVADAYDAMTSDRPYRRGYPPEEAVRRLLAGSGKQFDPEVVRAFVEHLKKQKVVDDAG
ncbi:MAG: HD-GYP domain-containing protein [Firmicutes bacterium]|nr:HD-GYP domain-containing protein [Bacillota bacterium]MDH7495247.1 HD-GYP domain-containing protein [Bacillota bacterium]